MPGRDVTIAVLACLVIAAVVLLAVALSDNSCLVISDVTIPRASLIPR